MALPDWIMRQWPVLVVVGSCGVVVLAILFCWFLWQYKLKRQKQRNGYIPIQTPLALPDKFFIEKQKEAITKREQAMMTCQYYLRNMGHYSDIQQLDEIGRRKDKYWFLVHDSQVSRKLLLSSVPYNPQMVLPFTGETRNNIMKLYTLIQHPYILPLSNVDFLLEEGLIIIVRPFGLSGSLKDEIHQSRCLDNHYDKYMQVGHPLPFKQIQIYASQVLKALLHLQQNNFPVFTHLHSGNVIIHNGICRLADIESTLFQEKYMLHSLIRKKLADAPIYALSTLTFGHLLFEMCTGLELQSVHPQADDMACCVYPAASNILEHIFENKLGHYPTLEELANFSFFRDVQHPALKNYKPSRVPLPQNIKDQLRSIRKGKLVRVKSRRTSNLSTTEETESSKSLDGKKTKKRPSSVSSRESNVDVISLKDQPESLPLPPPLLPPPGIPSTSARAMLNVSGERSSLLSDIRKGAILKKTENNDKSGPSV